MYLEVYPDIVFILNFFLDLVILYILKMINRKSSRKLKMVIAAMTGALFAVVVSLFPWMNAAIRFLFLNAAGAFCMLFIAFGRLIWSDFIKQMISLYLLTYVIGGLMNSLYYYTKSGQWQINFGNGIIFDNINMKQISLIMLCLIPISWVVIRIYRSFSIQKEIFDLEIIIDSHKIRTKGLMDTGNCLYDPYFRRPVIVAENTLMEKLMGEQYQGYLDITNRYLNEFAAGNEVENMDALTTRVCFIPYQSIGKPQGLMPGIIVDKVILHTGKETVCSERVTVAICDNLLSVKGEYQVILHKGLL